MRKSAPRRNLYLPAPVAGKARAIARHGDLIVKFVRSQHRVLDSAERNQISHTDRFERDLDFIWWQPLDRCSSIRKKDVFRYACEDFLLGSIV